MQDAASVFEDEDHEDEYEEDEEDGEDDEEEEEDRSGQRRPPPRGFGKASQSVESVLVSRKASQPDFRISYIDTPGLLDGDSVNENALSHLAEFLSDKSVDAILYVDRVDTYRVTACDRQIMLRLANTLGPQIWSITMLVLTHGHITLGPPDGLNYRKFTAQRAEQLRNAIREVAGPSQSSVSLPVTVVENKRACPTNSMSEAILPDGTIFVPQLLNKLADLAIQGKSLEHDALDIAFDVYSRKRRRWVIPIFLFNAFLLRPLLIKQIRKDPDYN
eukprot:gene22013-26521_t